MLKKAREFAVQAHGDQKYGDHPYSYHLDAVVQLLAPYDETAQIVGYLHDVVEDTHVSVEDIESEFGTLVARCVGLLSDEPGKTRKERKAKTYAKLALVRGSEELALTVKAADRLANVRATLTDKKRGLWEVYRSEHSTFRAAAFRAGQCEPLWWELDKLLEQDALEVE